MTIASLIRGYSMKDALDALYYTARFIKQAGRINVEDKDFFDDDVRSAPSEEARELARKLIAVIEADVGRPAAEFDFPLVIKIMNDLTSAEAELDIRFTAAEKEGAEKAIESMIEPTLREKELGQTRPRKEQGP